MDYVLILCFVGFGGIIVGFIGYKLTTERIIKDQERQIRRLERELNKRKQDYPETIHIKPLTPEGKKVLTDLFERW